VPVTAEYQIGVEDAVSGNILPGDYNPDLVETMDRLTVATLGQLTFQRRLRAALQQQQRRNLKAIESPTGVPTYEDISCPSGLGSNFLCRNAAATVVVAFDEGEVADPAASAEEFRVALLDAINAGDMQSTLDTVNSNSPVIILNGQDFAIAPTSRTEGISNGGIAGIVIGSALLLLLGLVLLVRRNRDDEDEAEMEKRGSYELDPALNEDSNPALEDAASTSTSPSERKDRSIAGGVLGAASPNYGSKIVTKRSHDEEDKYPYQTKSDDSFGAPMDDHDSSSNAGSSGWSSSAGVSSLNTGSADGLGLDDDPTVGIAGGTSLAAIGVASYQRGALDSESSEPSQSSVSRADLDSAIEAGDWAAVGATAAILAAASDSQSYSSRSGALSGSASISQSGTSFSSLDAARAAELDHLVDAGDWEGVVLAAAKFEAAEGSTSAASQSQSIVSESERSSESGTAGSATYRSASVSGSLGSSQSKALRRQELRAQVVELVERVVPEEINNVDEMMLQFRGREEELVETLRTMQERAVAQKARQSSQKAAKAEAKRQVKESRSLPPLAPQTTKVSESEESESSSKRSKNESSTQSGSFPDVKARSLGTGMVSKRSIGGGTATSEVREQKQSALERAIEAGDWEAVSEAAAMMSEGSMTSADTDEINRLASGAMSDASSAGTSKGDNSERAAELDELIDKGDWTGVVAAASRYSKTDVADGKVSQEEIEERRKRRQKRVQEEEDALKQAEIWMAIAEQSKQEPEQESRGASDAADWAIARSLSLLVEQEQQGHLTNDPSGGLPSHNEEDDDQEEV